MIRSTRRDGAGKYSGMADPTFEQTIRDTISRWQEQLLQLDRRNGLLYLKVTGNVVPIRTESIDEFLEKLTAKRGGLKFPYADNISADSEWVLLFVHRSADSGSPRVAGATRFSSAGTSSGCTASWRRRPPPLRRTLTTSSVRAPPRTSVRPSVTVLIARPVARATAAIPPQP